jgi:putative ABC transport system permease protein
MRKPVSKHHDTGRGNGMSVLRRVTGMASAGSLALALLAGGCVLAATVGPRQAQATGARALQQTMNAVAPLDKTIVAGSSWTVVNAKMSTATGNLSDQDLTQADVDQVPSQLRRDFSTGPLRLTPRPADWFGMNPGPYLVLKSPPTLQGLPGKLEVTYRYPLAGHLRLVAGSMPDTAPRMAWVGSAAIFTIQVVLTPQTASRYDLQPGSQLAVSTPLDDDMEITSGTSLGATIVVRLDVTGIVEPVDRGSSFWNADPLLLAPGLDRVGGASSWEGAVIADPGETDMMQQIFGQSGLLFQWVFPVNTAVPHAQTQALYSQVNQIINQSPRLTGHLAPMATALSVTSGLVQPLAVFIQASDDVNVLLLIVYAGLALAGLVTLLLAARMVAGRRSAELTLRRARGASLWRLFSLGTRGAAVACVPAAALAWALAVLLVPGATPAGSAAWWPGIGTLAFAATAPGIAAAWQHRPARRRRARQRWPWLPRVVLEITACAAAIGAITVFRTQTGATDLYTSAAPLLVAIPAVIVALRLYQLVLRVLARAWAQQRGIIGFLGLTRAAQAPVTLALPAMTLVLALTVASFTGMVREAVDRGETAASWQATGADVVITAGQLGISPSAVRAIAAVPGVKHAASAVTVPLSIDAGSQLVTAIVVDPASYATLVASTEGFSPIRPALLARTRGQGTIPVLASPQAAAYLGEPGGTTISAQQGLPTLRVQVAGELRSTPALPAGGAFIVLPMSAIHGIGEPPNLILLTGPSIDMTRLDSAVRATMPGPAAPIVTTRSQALRELAGAPLQQGTFLLFTLAIAYAAALALAVMLLELALGAADRALTAARLATMGLTEGQRVRLVALEVLPSIAASAVAAAACAIALPRLVAPAIDLSVFTQSQAPVPLRSDFVSFMLPLAALLVITIIALAYEIRSGRGRLAAMMLA